MKVELHCHSSASDGSLSPLDLIKQAKDKQIDILALTDHDTTSGIAKAKEAGIDLGVKIIPGIELSTKYKGENVHILGYFRDDSYNSTAFQSFLTELLEYRAYRGKRIVDNLKKYFNIYLDYEKIKAKVPGVLGRPHIARALIEDNYAVNFDEVFSKFIGKNSPAYVPNKDIFLEDGVAILKDTNALVVLAHPVLIKRADYKEIALKNFDGIEVYYSSHSAEAIEEYYLFAKVNELLHCGGSDFHGLKDKNHGYLGEISPPAEDIEKFLKALNG